MTGLYLVGLLTIPTRVAASSTVSSDGAFAKKVWDAALIPYALLPKKIAFIYIFMISSLV